MEQKFQKNSPASGVVYGSGIYWCSDLFYFICHRFLGRGAWISKSLVWPVFLVYEAFNHLGM